MADPGEGDELRRLGERIDRVRRAHRPAPRERRDEIGQAHVAWRMIVELVTGLLMGFAIGYGLDALLGTGPVLLVVLTLLGFAAGVRIMLRTAEELSVRRDNGADDADRKGDAGRG